MAPPRHIAQSRVAAEAAETALKRSLGLLDDWADYPRRKVEAEYFAVSVCGFRV